MNLLQNLPDLKAKCRAKEVPAFVPHSATALHIALGLWELWSAAAREPATTTPLWKDAA
jgi:hypothetical protein